MKKTILIFSSFLIVIFGLINLTKMIIEKEQNFPNLSAKKIPIAERLSYFHQYDIDRTKDPMTGEIPIGIRERVLNFVSRIPSREDIYFNSELKAKFGDYSPGIFNWQNAGPSNIGGRMNCIELDIKNEKIILSGAASGGVWRSIDAGKSWVKTTSPNEIQSIYCIAQDKRNNKTNVWYYGTGELLSTIDRKVRNSARMSYPGNGIYKSTDNGSSWFPLLSTQSTNVGSLSDNFQGIWKIIPDFTSTNQDIVFAACFGGIMKSTNGGNSWELSLGDSENKSFSSDLEMANDGTLYASMSSISNTGKLPKFTGIFKSTDKGNSWSDITPANFQPNTKVIKLGLAPTTNNTLYAYIDYPRNNSFDPYAFQNTSVALWKATNLKTGISWTEISSSTFPSTQEVQSPTTLGGYAMTIKVKPDDENSVFLGATSLYRSKNGFNDNLKVTQIGGYYWDNGGFNYDLSGEYLHPDLHGLVFVPSNPNKVYAVSDGGVHYSENISGLVPEWTQKNDGLITSQFYSISIGQNAQSKNLLLGGLQDNGSFYNPNKTGNTHWEQVSGGDGMHTEIANDGSFIITSWYNGSMIYSTIDPDSFEPNWAAYATPQDIPTSGYMFYNMFLLDPNDNNSLYLPAKNKIFYNHKLNLIKDNNSEYNASWEINPPEAFVFPTNEMVTALKISKAFPDLMFVGTNAGKVYVIENINNPSSSSRYEITYSVFPKNGWVSCIDYDEQNSTILVTFSNYNSRSIFASTDLGDTWSDVGGNLEENADGTGAGPSVRWIKAVNLSPKSTYYFVATDVGLFSANKLAGDATIWLQEGKTSIGNVIVEMIDTYNNELAIATQGAGIFIATLPNSAKSDNEFITNLNQNNPNPADSYTKIEFTQSKSGFAELDLYDLNGRKVISLFNGFVEEGKHSIGLNTSKLNPGIYFYTLSTQSGKITKKMIIQR